MPAFSLSVFDTVTKRDYLNLAAGAIALRVPVYGLRATDQILAAVFTAETPGVPDATDLAATTVQRTLAAATDAGWEGIRTPAGFPLCTNLDFLLSPVDAAKLTTAHDYDVRLYVSRLLPDAVTRVNVDRVLQYGSISVLPAITQTP